MTNCWSANPNDRPQVSSVRELLENYSSEVENGTVQEIMLHDLRGNMNEIMENVVGEKC